MERVFKSTAELKSLLDKWRSNNMKVVFTNGCFDIIHRGHVEYLQQSKQMGDVLIVGLNTDESVKRLKGEGRPINDNESRAIVLSALRMIDAIVFFDDDTPEQIIKNIIPDVLVKGSEYKLSEIVGADFVISNGGEVKTVEMINGYSTSIVISKIIK